MPYIRKKGKKWQATVRLPNGQRISHSDQLKSVVKKWATDMEAKFARGEVRDPRAGDISIGEWRERVRHAKTSEGSTKAKTETLWRTHCETKWAGWPLSAPTRLEAQEWVNELCETKLKRRRGRDVQIDDDDVPTLSAETIHAIVHVMSGLYKAAMSESPPIVIANPFADLDLPVISPGAVEFYESDEADKLYVALEEIALKWRTLAELGMEVGLRPGEIYGLHGHRVDWSRDQIHVVDVMTRQGVKAWPKSKKSNRTVPVPPDTVKNMSTLMEGRDTFTECTCPKVKANGVVVPGTGPCPGLVFTAPDGGPIDDVNFRNRVWNPAIKAADIRRFSPKIMRHTAASWLAQAGVSLYKVQALLGHESFATTQRYAHLAPDAHDEVIEAWERRRSGLLTPV